jgi:homoserine kinase
MDVSVFTVSVPASSANIGPGFDSMGMALNLFNHFSITSTATLKSDTQIWSANSSQSAPPDSRDTTNSLFFKTVDAVYTHYKQTRPPLVVQIEAHIPLARGLGSSSSVIVAGVITALIGLGLLPSGPDGHQHMASLLPDAVKQTIMSLVNRIEGHPDNVLPALLGGIGLCDEDQATDIAYYYPLNWPMDWHILVVIPDTPLLTHTARQVLPKQVTYADAVFNLRKNALLIWAILHNDSTAMAKALTDRLHQPYRSQLMPLFGPLQQASELAGALGTVISGAGPSVAVFCQESTLANVKQAISNCLLQHSQHEACMQPLAINTSGACWQTNIA